MNSHTEFKLDQGRIESDLFDNFDEDTLSEFQRLTITKPKNISEVIDSIDETDTTTDSDSSLEEINSEEDENEEPPNLYIEPSIKQKGCGDNKISTSHTKVFRTSSDASFSSKFNRKMNDIMPVPEDADEYNMNHKRRGRAVIFNHYFFESDCFATREGTKFDVERLEEKFSALEFEVKTHHNLTYHKIISVLSKMAKEDHSDADCLIVVVLTHGEGGCLVPTDSHIVYNVESIWSQFTADKCPTLAGKPKLFFIQGCGAYMRSPGYAGNMSHTIPIYADILLSFSTVTDSCSYRNTEKGSWFIQALCQELNQSDDLLQILTRTTRRVSMMETPGKHYPKQVPSIISMLRRNLYFRPKNVKPET